MSPLTAAVIVDTRRAPGGLALSLVLVKQRSYDPRRLFQSLSGRRFNTIPIPVVGPCLFERRCFRPGAFAGQADIFLHYDAGQTRQAVPCTRTRCAEPVRHLYAHAVEAYQLGQLAVDDGLLAVRIADEKICRARFPRVELSLEQVVMLSSPYLQ